LLHDSHLLRIQLHALRLLVLLRLLLHVVLLLLLWLHGHSLLQVLRLHHNHSLLVYLRLLLLRPLLLHHQYLLLLRLHLRMELLLGRASHDHALSPWWCLLHHLLWSDLLLLLWNDHSLPRLELPRLQLPDLNGLPDLTRLLLHLHLLLLLLLRQHHSRLLLLLLLLDLNRLRRLLRLNGHPAGLKLLQLGLTDRFRGLVGIDALLNLERFLFLVSVICDDHVVLTRLLPELLQGLLGIVGLGGHSVEL
jgi:hypothetical protein